MRARTRLALAAAATLVAGALHAAEIDKHLAPLQPLVGKTWRGELSPPGAAKPVVDVSRFELALNGRAVRSLHSINDGEYGGETLFVWDDEKRASSTPTSPRGASTPPARCRPGRTASSSTSS
jgi:hypothetical protein